MQAWLAKIVSAIGIELFKKLGAFIVDAIKNLFVKKKIEQTQAERDPLLDELQAIADKQEKTAADILRLKELHRLLNEKKP